MNESIMPYWAESVPRDLFPIKPRAKKTSMREKYIIRLGDEALAFRYDFKTGEAMLGGVSRLRADMESLIEDIFKSPVPRPTYPQERKMRFNWKMPKKKFDPGFGLLKSNGWIEPVQSHGRIVR